MAFQVAAESSSTGEVDNSLSSSRSPKLQGKISGASDRDELQEPFLLVENLFNSFW
ncbi:hypothetical protein J4727_17980 [Providencia rettgeri]|uniref:Uncharacterized protein n=1 Tax=Providencia rettgeri TaxID=587 RepID=A0A939ND15_PRORE|nr:hypothetical protein [Providencia rettgeri]